MSDHEAQSARPLPLDYRDVRPDRTRTCRARRRTFGRIFYVALFTLGALSWTPVMFMLLGLLYFLLLWEGL